MECGNRYSKEIIDLMGNLKPVLGRKKNSSFSQTLLLPSSIYKRKYVPPLTKRLNLRYTSSYNNLRNLSNKETTKSRGFKADDVLDNIIRNR